MYLAQSTNCVTFQIELDFRSVGFLGEGTTRVPGEKHLGARTRTNNKVNSYDAETMNQTQVALVGGECSHHCSIPALTKMYM